MGALRYWGTERHWGSQMFRGALKGIGVLLEVLGVFSAVLGYSQRYWGALRDTRALRY